MRDRSKQPARERNACPECNSLQINKVQSLGKYKCCICGHVCDQPIRVKTAGFRAVKRQVK